MIDAWHFQPYPCPLGEGEDLEIELIINHAYAVKPPLKKIRKVGDSKSLWIVNVRVPGEWCTTAPREQKPLCLGPFQTTSYVSLHRDAHLFPLLCSS